MRRTNADDDDINACVLGRWGGVVQHVPRTQQQAEWERGRGACGPDAPDRSTAAKRLADKRWQKSLRIQARDLRTDTADVIARAQRQGNPHSEHADMYLLALASRLARGGF